MRAAIQLSALLRLSARPVIRGVNLKDRALSSLTRRSVASVGPCHQRNSVQMKTPMQEKHFHTCNRLCGEVVQFNLADIGEGIAQVNVTEWYVDVGDKVQQFDQICEVKSDKASVTITSRYQGTVRKLYYEVDEEANVGSPIVDIELESTEEDTLRQQIAEPEPIFEESTSMENTLPPAPTTGASIERKPVLAPAATPAAPVHETFSPGETKGKVVPATPAVRKIAKEQNIDLADVTPTGSGGRVLKEDILSFIAKRDQPKTAASQPPPPPLVAPLPSAEDRVEPIRGIRKAMVTSMIASLQVPTAGYSDEVDVSELIRVRKSLKNEVGDVKLTLMPFFMKAASLAMLQHPIVNSVLDLDNMNIIYKAQHNIRFAMDTPEGLIVPVVRNVQSRSILEVAMEMTRLSELGLLGKLGMDDLVGGTFSISNIGSIGGTYVQAIVNPPEVAIGALGKVQRLPRFSSSGEVVAVDLMNVSWSLDHRVIDGASMARFSNTWKSFVENPAAMLIHTK